jgi:hypothetical protein
MLKHVMTVYGYGYDIDAIAYDVDKSEDEVLGMIQHFKDINSKSGRKYSDELQSLIISRYNSGISVFMIEKELGVGKGVVKRLLLKQGIDVPKTKKQKNKETYAVINHQDFSICPDCNSRNVKDMNKLYIDEGTDKNSKKKKLKPHSYCFDCGTEWYQKGSETHKVLFHELNDDDED